MQAGARRQKRPYVQITGACLALRLYMGGQKKGHVALGWLGESECDPTVRQTLNHLKILEAGRPHDLYGLDKVLPKYGTSLGVRLLRLTPMLDHTSGCTFSCKMHKPFLAFRRTRRCTCSGRKFADSSLRRPAPHSSDYLLRCSFLCLKLLVGQRKDCALRHPMLASARWPAQDASQWGWAELALTVEEAVLILGVAVLAAALEEAARIRQRQHTRDGHCMAPAHVVRAQPQQAGHLDSSDSRHCKGHTQLSDCPASTRAIRASSLRWRDTSAVVDCDRLQMKAPGANQTWQLHSVDGSRGVFGIAAFEAVNMRQLAQKHQQSNRGGVGS